MSASVGSRRSRFLAAAMVMLLGAGCGDLGLNPQEARLAAVVAIKAAIYEELVALRGHETIHAYCLSEGVGPSPQDAPKAVLDLLSNSPTRFVPLSACVLDGHVRESDRPAQLFHIERLDVTDDHASVVVYYQRNLQRTGAGGYECTLKKGSGIWAVESCSPHPDNDDLSIRTNLYREFSTYIPWGSAPWRSAHTAYCLSEGTGAERRDPEPAGVVLSRLVRPDGPVYALDSTCMRNGVPHAPGNRRAVALHVEQIERDGDRALATVVVTYELTVIEIHCEMTIFVGSWTRDSCWSDTQSETTDDGIAIRGALYDHLAVPRYPDSWNGKNWCIYERTFRIGTNHDPSVAVMDRLNGDAREFHPHSTCPWIGAINAEHWLGARNAPSGERAGVIYLDPVIRHHDHAEARAVVLYPPHDLYSWHCRLENPGAGAWTVDACTYTRL